MVKELLVLEPDVKEMVWGKEYWTVSGHPHGDCTIAEGTYRGMKLSELWNTHRELFGNLPGDGFPLLVKLLVTKEKLSVQVHPDDEYARTHGDGSTGKAECWYVMEAGPTGTIMLGHNAQSREDAERMIQEGKWKDFLKETPIQKGEFIQLNPGTVHAILGGTTLMEVQQSSDITYRFYDYDRLFNGKLRQLHLKESLDVMRVPDDTEANHFKSFPKEGFESKYYKLRKAEIKSQETFEMTDPFQIVSVVEGSGEIDGHKLTTGDSLVVPCGYGSYTISGDIVVLISSL